MRGTVVLLVLLGGCTFGRLDGLTGGPAIDAVDAAVVDANADADAGPSEGGTIEDAGDAGAVVLLTTSFEDTSTCVGASFNSTLGGSANGRNGGRACRVCGQGAGPDSFSYNIEVGGAAATVGARYHATAWYRNSNTGPSADTISFVLRSFDRDPFKEVETSPKFGIPSGDFQRIDVDFVLTKPADGVDVFLSENYGANVCFVIDDLVVTRTN